ALGVERTIEQDPAFAIRVMVDVAIRALSPAVNDPTTAVQVLGYLGETMRLIGTTDLGRRSRLQDENGRTRVLLPVRRWEDYLALGVTEIREYGGNAGQGVRRPRAPLDNPLETGRPQDPAAGEDARARPPAPVAAELCSPL